MSRGLEERVQGVLRRYLSAINAGSILHRAKARTVGEAAEITRENAPTLFDGLRTGFAMFCGDAKWDSVMAELVMLLSNDEDEHFVRRVDVEEQDDIVLARGIAQEACAHAGADRYLTQKIVTAVSELARNIADYSHGGFVEITRTDGRIVIVAEDRGPGIENLDRILAGTYRSRTGLGRGLRGVHQMMDNTDIETGPEGTRIRAEVSVWR